MSYAYSQTNRLQEPHSYMYTPFEGEVLLQSYQISRMTVLRRRDATAHAGSGPDYLLAIRALSTFERLFDAASFEAGRKFRSFVEDVSPAIVTPRGMEDSSVDGWADSLEALTPAEPVVTLDLLHALIAVQLNNVQDANTKLWLDRLVQRFEVAKKLYEFYPPGFRKGGGSNTSIRLYWLFALALCLFHAGSRKIKYLSTLLKVADLLCSLPENMLQGNIPVGGMPVVLAAEIVSVQLLAERKGVSFASK